MATATAADETTEAPAPPPKRQPEARVQMNVRIRAERDKILHSDERQHGASRQAVVDQMVDEYLQRRGLLRLS